MEVRVLGPVEVGHDGSLLRPRGTKPRQLLTLLATHANHVVAADRLIEQLWEGQAPPTAATSLRVHVLRVREALEPDRDPGGASLRLPAVRGGYVLVLDPGELDVQRFERLVTVARHANDDGDPVTAAARLHEALALWRGRALEDIRDLDAGRAEVARLETLWSAAVEELAEAQITLGQHALVLDLLADAIERDPLREHLTELHMTALYRCGRQADALAAYSRLARALDERLAVRPSAELRRLEEDILLQRTHLDLVSPSVVTGAGARGRPATDRFIGRRAELARLVDAHADAARGHGRRILLGGPAGVGKSTLVDQYVDAVVATGDPPPVIGHCEPSPSAPYEPIVELLRGLIERGLLDGAELPPELAVLLPGVVVADADGRADVASDAAGARYRLFRAVVTALAAVPAPLALVIEDLHWADRSTLALVRHLLRSSALEHVAFVGTYRDDDIDGVRAEALERIAAPPVLDHERLEGFTFTEVRALIRTTVAPDAIAPLLDHAAALHHATAGHPLFLRELLRDLDARVIELHGRHAVERLLDAAVPASLRDLVDGRLARLTPDARAVLEAAAVLGRDFDRDVLGAVTGRAPDVVADAIEENLAAHLVVEDARATDRYEFPHILTRNAVLTSLPDAQLRDLHHAAARALVGLVGRDAPARASSADIARHFLAALDADTRDEAVLYAARAGEEASARFAWDEAARWYDDAVRVASDVALDDVSRGELHLALALAWERAQQSSRAGPHFAAAADCARRAGSYGLLADVALAAYGPWTSGSGYAPVALELLEESLAHLEPDAADRRVEILNGIATAVYYADPRREGEAARAAMAAAEHGSAASRALAQLALRRWYTHEPSARAERLALTTSALSALRPDREAGELYLRVERGLIADQLENGELAAFHASVDDYEARAVRLGSPRDIYWSMALRATEATMRGELALGEQLARGAALRGQELEQHADETYLFQRFVIRYQQGRLQEELPSLRGAATADTVFQCGAALPATAHAHSGRLAQAARIARDTVTGARQLLARDVFWLGAVALFAGVAAIVGDVDLCDRITDLLAPCADSVIVFGTAAAVLGTGHHWLAELALARGDLAGALAHGETALARADELAMPYWRAEAQIVVARARLLRGGPGDRACAEALRAEAIDTAGTAGFGRVLALATRLDRASPRRDDALGPPPSGR